jgi:hypothetical protein
MDNHFWLVIADGIILLVLLFIADYMELLLRHEKRETSR